MRPREDYCEVSAFRKRMKAPGWIRGQERDGYKVRRRNSGSWEGAFLEGRICICSAVYRGRGYYPEKVLNLRSNFCNLMRAEKSDFK